uniref:Uncharacterized protein n=1 Tax=Biomphalaria glabrata TaxID=6526 RepID=A0A2C9LDK8_BIOGL
MNWVGGARNRLKGTHKNDMRLQKEYFERKRLGLQLNSSSAKTNVESGKSVPKKSKISQDIISFQRQCKMSAANALDMNPNYRRVNLNSRSQGVNKFGVNTVHLPLSPVDRPSRLQLASPSGAIMKSSKGYTYPGLVMSSSRTNTAQVDLFGEPVLKPYRSATVYRSSSPQDTHGSEYFFSKNAANETSNKMKLYSPKDKRSFETLFNSEHDTVPTSLYNTSFNNDETSLFNTIYSPEQASRYPCHSGFPNLNSQPVLVNSYCYEPEPNYKRNCSAHCCPVEMFSAQTPAHFTHASFGEDKTNFSVQIVPSPESQEELSSETSTLNWSHVGHEDFSHLEFPEEQSDQLETSSKPYKHRQAKTTNSFERDESLWGNENSQPRMTSIKETHRRQNKSMLPRNWQLYQPEITPSRSTIYGENMATSSFVVSSGLDFTPDVRLKRNGTYSPVSSNSTPIYLRRDDEGFKSGLSTCNVVESSTLNTLTSSPEDPTQSLKDTSAPNIFPSSGSGDGHKVKPGLRIRKASDCDRRIRDKTCTPVSSETVQHVPTYTHRTDATPHLVDSMSKLGETNAHVSTIHQSSLKEQVKFSQTSSLILLTPPEPRSCQSSDHCNSVITSPRDQAKVEVGQVTSGADVADDDVQRSQSVVVASEGVNVASFKSESTQTTIQVFKDAANSPIRGLVATQQVSSNSLEDGLISSSV